MKRLLCWIFGHRARMYRDLRRVSPERVECPCSRCGKVLVATYGLAINAHHDWTR